MYSATSIISASTAASTPGSTESFPISASISYENAKSVRKSPRQWRRVTAISIASELVAEERADVDPQRRLMSAELKSRINEVLGGLTPRERMVFEMRHFQGMRLRAIGEALDTTEEAAKNCLFRATQKMRAALGDFT